ncbi:MAG: PEP-CTERM sorting domain-containing protein [Thiobacillus sp.]
MTIEEIGVASGGLGTSALSADGGNFIFDTSFPSAFSSAGGSDGAILPGVTQGDGAFTPGFLFATLTVTPNTLIQPVNAYIDAGGNLILDLSGWQANVEIPSSGTTLGTFVQFPDPGTLVVSFSRIDDKRYYYTADWSHALTESEDMGRGFQGIPALWHIEGIATETPEPGTLWLLGASALGLMLSRRSKRT